MISELFRSSLGRAFQLPTNLCVSESPIRSETVRLGSMMSERLSILVQCGVLSGYHSSWTGATA